MSPSYAPCAACKCLRRKCTQECVFAPYFPADNPQKFTNVHKVFGASNVAKLLNELSANQREDAVNSLAYEAEYRLRDPVYGCVGLVSVLQHNLRQVQHDLESAKKELATYIGPSAMLPILNHPGLMQQQQQQQNFGPSVHQIMPYHSQQMMFPMGAPHGGQLMIREPQQQQQPQQLQPQPQQQQQLQEEQQHILEAQQLAAMAAVREQEMLRACMQLQQQQQQLQYLQQQQQQQQQYVQQQQQQQYVQQQQQRQYVQQQQQQQQQQQHSDLLRFNDWFDDAGGPATATGLNQMPAAAAAAMQPALALGGSYETHPYHHIQQHAHSNAQEHSHSQSHPHSHHPHQLQLRELFLQQEQQQSVTTHHQLQQTLHQLDQPQTSHSQQQTQRDESEDGRSIGPSW